MQTVPHEFAPKDLIAGHVALDFTNTVTARDTTPRDWLDGYGRFIEWARLACVVDAATAARLESMAQRAPREAAAALGRARKVREALHAVCVALLRREEPPGEALDEVEAAWKRAASRGRLAAGQRQLRLVPDLDASGFDLPLDVVVFEALGLLSELDADRTRVCRGHDCGWLFADTSKSGRRVWCDMATCGNTAKSERFARGRRRKNH
ncbi:MAG TPA: ABATE domain-containing protein [Steroidobacteraceae bacterium]|nr:ABATE domain-containing protein [Steroidobacteraceae bacterium]